ncbi:hypothetical protein NQ317_013741, partial [Molorchus minor]
MTVVFTTDVSIHMAGFVASYISLPESKICGAPYYSSAGVIKSPGYPKEYPSNQQCTWTITVDPGKQILLNVTDFSIESYMGCRYDYLEIRNGGTSSSPLIDRYCGTDIPKLISSHTNQFYLFFKSDMSCGGSLTSPSGSIISPNYPEPYSRNAD